MSTNKNKNMLPSGVKCCVKKCKKSKRNYKKLKMFKFPAADMIFGQIWRDKCKIPKKDYDKTLFVCGNHFLKTQIGRKKLKADAIPTIDLDESDDDSEVSATRAMNLNCDTFIKQENDEEFISCLSKADLNIPVINEAILEKSYSSITIKTETLSEVNLNEVPVVRKTQNSLQNQETATADQNTFIINELETLPATNKFSAVIQQSAPPIIKDTSTKADLNIIHAISEAVLDESYSSITIKSETLSESNFPEEPVLLQIENSLQNKETATTDQNTFIINELETLLATNKLSPVLQQTAPPMTKDTSTNADINIPVINEALLDEPYSSITIQSETLSESNFPEEPVLLQIENSLQNKETATVDQNTFIIKELETLLATNKLSPADESILRINELDIPRLNVKSIPSNYAADSPAIDPPSLTLLNTQFRKRNKVILEVSPADKRTRYNINETSPVLLDENIATDPSQTSKACHLLNTGSTQIINHLITQGETEESCVPTESFTITAHSDNPNEENSMACTIVRSSNPANWRSAASPTVSKLPIVTGDDAAKESAVLKGFFNRMYEKTRLLNKKQQGKVKMILLKAICDAEMSEERAKRVSDRNKESVDLFTKVDSRKLNTPALNSLTKADRRKQKIVPRVTYPAATAET